MPAELVAEALLYVDPDEPEGAPGFTPSNTGIGEEHSSLAGGGSGAAIDR